MEHLLVKVNGSLRPLTAEDARCLEEFLAAAGVEALLRLEGDWLELSYAGLCFPWEEFLTWLQGMAEKGAEGSFDYLDLEHWRLTRLRCGQGKIHASTRGLNDILNYSGF